MGKIVYMAAALVLVAILIPACQSNDLHSAQERDMTVGLVQKEIRVGMSQADVIAALGSPNIVSRGDGGKEAYVYDKIATEASYSSSSSGVSGNVSATGAGMTPGNVLLLGTATGGGSHKRNKGTSATTQRTLTVIIKFDESAKVESFSYHSSKF